MYKKVYRFKLANEISIGLIEFGVLWKSVQCTYTQ